MMHHATAADIALFAYLLMDMEQKQESFFLVAATSERAAYVFDALSEIAHDLDIPCLVYHNSFHTCVRCTPHPELSS